MNHSIIEATVRDLSSKDIEFLHAMLRCNRVASLSEIAAAMGVSPNYAGTYKSRLLAQGVLEERGRGKVAFAIPGLPDYLLRSQQEPEY